MQGLDQSLFRAINGWPDWMDPFYQLMSEGNKWLPVRILLGGIILWFAFKGGRWRAAAILAVLAWLVSNELCDVLKNGLQMARPSVEMQDAELILRVKRLTSFGTASAHSASMAAVATVFTWLLGRWGWPWIALAFFVGLSRIYVGVHYPSQVLFGWCVGACVATVAVLCWNAILRWRAKPEPVKETDEGVANPSA